MEWLTLLVLIPAIVVPVVLLLGFAGCDFVFKLEPRPKLPTPIGVFATPISVSEISLTWTSNTTETGVQFEIERAKDGSPFERIATVPGPPFVDPTDTGSPAFLLEPGFTYNYRVIAIEGDRKSDPSEVARARPLAFAFDLSTPAGSNQGFGGDCIVQRIDRAMIRNWGTVVRIHVRGSTDSSLTINNIYISRVARAGVPPNPNPDAYDSDTDIAMVAVGILVPQNTSVPVNLASTYTIPDPPEDLLIAFDISSNSGQGRVRHAPLAGLLTYQRDATQQASQADRFPNSADPTLTYNTLSNKLFLLEKIEVL